MGTPIIAGNLVQLRWESRSDAQLAAGVDRYVVTGQAVIQGEKIAAWIGQQDYSDAQTVKFQLFQQAKASASASAPAASK